MDQNTNTQTIEILSIQKAKHSKDLLEFSVKVASKTFTYDVSCSNKGGRSPTTRTHDEKFSFCVETVDPGTLKVGDFLTPKEMENIVAL